MGVFTNYLEKLGSNFLVSSMVPALALVVVSVFVFDPILNFAGPIKNPQETAQLISFSVIIFIITVILGFTLTALNTFILKFFEGYVDFFPIRYFFNLKRKVYQDKARSVINERDRLKNQIREHEGFNAHILGKGLDLDELRERHYGVADYFNMNYPADLDDVLPTRFGNTLKAAENYPGERYGLDGVHFWPRLIQVIPIEYKSSIDTARNELSFLVNMSILSALFSVFCMFAIVHIMWITPGAGSDPTVFHLFLYNSKRYFIALLPGLYLCRLFYSASLFSVVSFGLMIRSSFDLFRLDLLKKFGIKQPVDSIEEFRAWQNLNELIVLGSHSLTFKKIEYQSEE